MNVSEDERVAIATCIDCAEQFGYGNLISHLRTAWARKLVAIGLPAEGAHGGSVMPFKMQEDIIERGFWDHTGESYRVGGTNSEDTE